MAEGVLCAEGEGLSGRVTGLSDVNKMWVGRQRSRDFSQEAKEDNHDRGLASSLCCFPYTHEALALQSCSGKEDEKSSNSRSQ